MCSFCLSISAEALCVQWFHRAIVSRLATKVKVNAITNPQSHTVLYNLWVQNGHSWVATARSPIFVIPVLEAKSFWKSVWFFAELAKFSLFENAKNRQLRNDKLNITQNKKSCLSSAHKRRQLLNFQLLEWRNDLTSFLKLILEGCYMKYTPLILSISFALRVFPLYSSSVARFMYNYDSLQELSNRNAII